MGSSATRRTSESTGKDGKDRKGLLTRMKTILKKSGDSSASPSSSSKRHSTLSDTIQQEAEPVLTSAEPLSQMAGRDYSQYEGATKVPRAQVHEDRARRLSANYGVEIEPSEWHSVEGDVYRVEKPVRVRVHKDCHRCQVSFGTSNKCPNCNHHFCSKCGRTPPKRTESQKQSSREKREEAAQREQEFAPIIPHYGLAEPIVVTRPSKTGGQQLVHKPPRMRVRRSCHRCSTIFSSSTRVCENCGHRRCDDCPKSPTKKKKYPYGYPGDEAGPNSPAFHECHECHGIFPQNAEDGAECASCAHHKCPDCPRARRQRMEPEINPDILASISSRFEHLDLD